jgi:hypothetical protein
MSGFAHNPTRTVNTARADSDHKLFSARRLTRITVAASTIPSTAPNGTRTMAYKMTPMPSPGAQQCGPAAARTIIALATIPHRVGDLRHDEARVGIPDRVRELGLSRSGCHGSGAFFSAVRSPKQDVLPSQGLQLGAPVQRPCYRSPALIPTHFQSEPSQV